MRSGVSSRVSVGCRGLWLCVCFALAVVPLATAETPCPPWEAGSQTPLTPTTLPQALDKILAHHRGQGWLAQFVEEKHVRALQRPLRSSGTFIFLPPHGLYRHLKTPFEQELLVTITALYQRDHRNSVETTVLEKSPVAQALVEGFLALFSGSWASLQSHFRGSFTTDNARWTLGLTPVHAVMAQLISCLLLEGEQEQVSRLLVRETNGDVTRTQFVHAQLLPAAQWGDYQHYFTWGR
ncbi:MAG: outer membrane lipoprotein carrier protein LolA [Candidatus Tectimicrobiota bacterium]